MYYVWVCPLCKSHSQITQITRSNQKTTSCQSCGKRIQIRKIRIMGSFENINDAISLRSALHAQVKGPYQPIKYGELFEEIVEKNKHKIEKTIEKKPLKMSLDKVILRTIEENGRTSFDDIIKSCVEEGIDKEKAKEVLLKMLYAGIIYEPSKKVYDIVK